MKKENKNNKIRNLFNKKYKKQQIFILFLIFISLFSFVAIFARYLTNNMNDHFLRSKEFYFYSDKMDENTSIFQIDNWSGVGDYLITINLNSRKNNLQYATYDIAYDIKYRCSSNAICQVSKTEGIVYASNNADFFNLTITPNTQLKTGDKVVVDVEATSKTNYKKVLKARFTLVVGIENLSYQITDKTNSPFMDLSITNTISYYIVDIPFGNYTKGQKIDIDTFLALPEQDKNKCYSSVVTVEFDPNIILLDLTSESYKKATNITTKLIDGKKYVNKFTIDIEAISSENFRFYKKDVTKDYTYPNNNNYSVITINTKKTLSN